MESFGSSKGSEADPSPELLDPLRHDGENFKRYIFNLANGLQRDIQSDTGFIEREVKKLENAYWHGR